MHQLLLLFLCTQRNPINFIFSFCSFVHYFFIFCRLVISFVLPPSSSLPSRPSIIRITGIICVTRLIQIRPSVYTVVSILSCDCLLICFFVMLWWCKMFVHTLVQPCIFISFCVHVCTSVVQFLYICVCVLYIVLILCWKSKTTKKWILCLLTLH